MTTLTLNSVQPDSRTLETKTSLRLRAFRFLSKRFAQREQPGVFAEFALFAVIVCTAYWPLVLLGQALRLVR